IRPDGTRRYRRGYIEVPKKNGKALSLDTPLPTPEGWTTMGDVQVGDRLCDETGSPCNVVASTTVMVDRPCYEIVLSDDTWVIADAQHEWVTTTYEPHPVTAVWTTHELAINQSSTGSTGRYSVHWVPEVSGQAPARLVADIRPTKSVPVRC